MIAWKYYLSKFKVDIGFIIKEYDMCLELKFVMYKLYSNLKSFPILTHWCKDLFLDFITNLPISTKRKGDTYKTILVIIDQLMIIIHCKPFKITINASSLAKVINETIVQNNGLWDKIFTDWNLVFTSKFLSILCYFLRIKKKWSTIFCL